jgi:ketohexokinase
MDTTSRMAESQSMSPLLQHSTAPTLRSQCAAQLLTAAGRAIQLTAFIGLDGFVDEILHVVDKRESAEKYVRLPAIAQLAQRLAAAAGRSTNLELVSQLIKLGGNGPIMANALASFGLKVAYLGILGYPNLHPVFADFAKRAEVHSIAEPGYTDALEFEDGKIMLGKHQSLKEMNWENIKSRFGQEKFAAKFGSADLVGFVNWTMLTAMSEIWAAVLNEVCPRMSGPRRKLFIDLADPEKRTSEDILRALELITAFQKYFDVILGLNEKEGYEIGEKLGLRVSESSPESLLKLCREIHLRIRINTIIIHPTSYALASGPDGAFVVPGPFTPKPRITTGAGDHFNSGFCLGKLLGFPTNECLLTGVTTSGHYVRTGQSPGIAELASMLRDWPVSDDSNRR